MAPLNRFGQRGFTLLETLIVAALTLLLLLIATGLLLESQVVLIRATDALTTPSTELAATLIRRDIRRAQRTSGSTPRWTSEPLVLAQPDGSLVTFELNGSRLERHVQDHLGLVQTQVLVPEVASWLWREPWTGTLDWQITTRSRQRAQTLGPRPPRARVAAPGFHRTSTRVGPARRGY